MNRFLLTVATAAFAAFATSSAFADDDSNKFQVIPFAFDPANTHLVGATWLAGAGCPTGANVATYPATKPTGTYTDPACATGDTQDKAVQGLVLVKTGPTSNNASAGADIKGLKTGKITELGYDIR